MPKHRIKLSPFWWQEFLWKFLLLLLTLGWAGLQGFTLVHGKTLDSLDPWRGLDMAVFVVLTYFFTRNVLELYKEVIEERGWFRPLFFIGIYIAYLALIYGLARLHIAWAVVPALPGCIAPPLLCGVIRRRFRMWKGEAYRNVKPYGFVRRYYRQQKKHFK